MAFLHNKQIEKIRVLVIGDSYVGKSTIIHLICNNTILSNSSWTIGCKTDVKVYYYFYFF
jgi:Rab-like protein 3